MNRTEFEDALRKGLGRVLQHLRTNDGEPYRDLILAACLEDWRYDRQCEPSRSQYLFEIIQNSGDPVFYRAALLQHLETCPSENPLPENMRLAYQFASHGDDAMRQAMYAALERTGVENEFVGADELIELDGVGGLVHAARLYLAGHEEKDDWQLSSWIDQLEERDGEEAARVALDEVASCWPEFAQALATERREKLERARYWEKRERDTATLPWPEVREAILKDQRPKGTSALAWARSADHATFREAARDIMNESDPERLFKLLFLFHQRAFPIPPGPLLGLVRTADDRLAWRAAVVLSKVKHPSVRGLALELSRDAERLPFAAQLLEANWQEGDSALLVDILNRCEDIDDTHSVGFCVREIAKAHPVAEMASPLLLLYEKGLCSMCRYGVVKMLLQRDELPGHLRDECRLDVDLDTRNLVEHGPDAD